MVAVVDLSTTMSKSGVSVVTALSSLLSALVSPAASVVETTVAVLSMVPVADALTEALTVIVRVSPTGIDV